jgi:phosphate-selective porin OprO/OprP
MEPATSFREIMFMERSLAFALVPFRQVGAGFHNTAFEEQATWAVSGYRFPTDQYGNVAGDNGYGMSTRETFLLYNDEWNNVIHLGGSYTYNEPAGNTLRIRSTPEVGFTQLDANNLTDFPIPFYVNTGFLPTDSYQVVGGEFAAGFGSWVFQSEYMYAMLAEPAGPQLEFPAGYAQLGYVLTGERRNYDHKTAAFGRVVPDCNFGNGYWGAWEVAGRYSAIDLNDEFVQGGYLQDLTFGLNWYLNRYTRFEFNYIHTLLDRPVGNNTESDIFGTRAQFDF